METSGGKKFKMGVLLPLFIIGMGIMLMVFMIYTEDEPGALPLAMVVVGTIWYFIKRHQSRSQR